MLHKILFYLTVLGFAGTCSLQAQTQGAGTIDPTAAKQPVQTPAPVPAIITPTAKPKSVLRFLELGVGPTAYRGDLAGSYRKWSSAVHVGLKFNRKERLNGHLNLAIGSVTGQNAAYVFDGESEVTPTPNRFFKTSFFSFNYDLQINLIKTSRWIVYVSQGIGLMRYNPKDEYGNPFQGQFTSRSANETYGTVALMLPTQIGAMYLLPNGYGAGIQTGWANVQTDYLDNISLWGNRSKKDNMFWAKFQFIVPLVFVQP